MSVQSTALSRHEKKRAGRGPSPRGPPPVPFREKLTCSINDAVAATNVSRSHYYKWMNEGVVQFRHVGRHRVLIVASILKALGLDQEDAA